MVFWTRFYTSSIKIVEWAFTLITMSLVVTVTV